jgi:hypothetical protein
VGVGFKVPKRVVEVKENVAVGLHQEELRVIS